MSLGIHGPPHHGGLTRGGGGGGVAWVSEGRAAWAEKALGDVDVSSVPPAPRQAPPPHTPGAEEGPGVRLFGPRQWSLGARGRVSGRWPPAHGARRRSRAPFECTDFPSACCYALEIGKASRTWRAAPCASRVAPRTRRAAPRLAPRAPRGLHTASITTVLRNAKSCFKKSTLAHR